MSYFVLFCLCINFIIRGKLKIPLRKSAIIYTTDRIKHTILSLPNAATHIIGAHIIVRNKERLAAGVFISFSFSSCLRIVVAILLVEMK